MHVFEKKNNYITEIVFNLNMIYLLISVFSTKPMWPAFSCGSAAVYGHTLLLPSGNHYIHIQQGFWEK